MAPSKQKTAFLKCYLFRWKISRSPNGHDCMEWGDLPSLVTDGYGPSHMSVKIPWTSDSLLVTVIPNISKYAEMCCPLCDSSYMIWTLLDKCLDIDSCTTLAIPVRQPGNPNKPPFSFRAWINKVSSSSLQQQPWWLTSWAIVEEGSPLVWLFFFCVPPWFV